MPKARQPIRSIRVWPMFMVNRKGSYLRDDGGTPEWGDFTHGKQLPSRTAAIDYIEGMRLEPANYTIEEFKCVLEIHETQEGE